MKNKSLNSDGLSLHWSVEQWDTSLLGWVVTHEIIEVARVPAAVISTHVLSGLVSRNQKRRGCTDLITAEESQTITSIFLEYLAKA